MRCLAFLLVILLSGLCLPVPALAAGITIQHNNAVSQFPTTLRFELEASSDAPITDVVLLYSTGLDHALAEVRPDFEPGREVSLVYERDTQTYFLPTGVLLHYKWVLHDESGATYETPLQQVLYEDQRFNWQKRTAQGITVLWYEGGEEFGDALIQTALRTLERFERQFGKGLSDPVRITIYANSDDMRAALPPNSEEWIGGQARPDLGLVIGSVAPGNEPEIKRLIPHELSHLVLHQVTRNAYGGPPPWFDEGLAVVNQEEPDAYFDRLVEEAAREDRLIPLRALASSFPADPEQAVLSYAQSASIVRFIQETYSAEQFAVFVEQFSQGATPDEATQAAIGLGIDELDAQWRETLPAVEEPAPTATQALHAPADRFDIHTPDSSNLDGGFGREIGVGDDLPTHIGGLSLPLFALALIVGLGLLAVGFTLIVRALRR